MFGEAEYDGTNDVEVHVEPKGDRVAAVVATGQAVLFIEFGTGVSYPDSHPDAGVNGFQHGGYGHHLGALPDGWRYPLDNGLGTNGTIDADHPGYAHTYGNPANMSMYNTVKILREKLPELAREVFSS